MGREAGGGGRAEGDGRHEDGDSRRRHDLGRQCGDQEEPGDERPGPEVGQRAEEALGNECRGAGFLHRQSEAQHAGDEDHRLELDRPVGLLDGQTAGEDHEQGAGWSREIDGRQARHHGRQDPGHDDGADRRLLLPRRRLGLSTQEVEVGVFGETPQAAAVAVEKKGVAQLQRHPPQVGTVGAAVAPDGQDRDAVALPERQVGDGAAGEAGAGRERGLHHADELRLELGESRGRASAHLELLQRPQDGQVAAPTPKHVRANSSSPASASTRSAASTGASSTASSTTTS